VSVTVIGDAFVDMIVSVQGIKPGETHHRKIITLCGGTANVAVQVSRLGGKARFIGKVGNDVFGEYFKQNLERNGVEDLTFVDHKNSTGLCISLVYADGERTMIADRGANNYLTKEEIGKHLDEMLNSKITYFSGYSFMSKSTSESILHAMNACQGKSEIWFNLGAPNIIKNSFRVHISKFVDVLILNTDEAKAITGRSRTEEIVDDLKELVKVAVITRGREGCLLVSDRYHVHIPTIYLNAKDTTGAGDAFSAGFLAGKLKELDLVKCAELGNETALRFLKERSMYLSESNCCGF